MRTHNRVGVHRWTGTHEGSVMRHHARVGKGFFYAAQFQSPGWKGRKDMPWLQRDRVGMMVPLGKHVERLPVPRPTDQWRRHATVLRATGSTIGTYLNGWPPCGGI